MEFFEQFLETFILRKADEASDKGEKKQTVFWLITFVILIALALGIFRMKTV